MSDEWHDVSHFLKRKKIPDVSTCMVNQVDLLFSSSETFSFAFSHANNQTTTFF